MAAYYNENNAHAAQWLRGLIGHGHIAAGDVDERSILEVKADDLKRYDQCHFFAGIGGWSYALRLAGWPDGRSVWTGSCPCQPFSSAGDQSGSHDARHLWPAFHNLIRERRPRDIFGEQVAGPSGLAWWDHVAADLESDDYAAAAACLPAFCVGANHQRERLFWLASDTACVNGNAHDRLGASGERTASQPVGRLSSMAVSGGRWSSGEGAPCLPTLVRNHHGLSGILAGFGNAIVPQVAAAFVMAAAAGPCPQTKMQRRVC